MTKISNIENVMPQDTTESDFCTKVVFEKKCSEQGDQPSECNFSSKTGSPKDEIFNLFPEELPHLGSAIDNYQRVIYFEIFTNPETGFFEVQKLDFDYSKCGTILGCETDISDEDRIAAARYIFSEIRAAELEDFNLETYSKYLNFAYKDEEFRAQKNLTLSQDTRKILLKSRFSAQVPVPRFPSPFDVDFTGPTAIIARSRIPNLRFRRVGLTFRNPYDARFYRDLEVDDRKDLKELSFFNAYWDIQNQSEYPRIFPKKLEGKSIFSTPFNQVHKIDFELAISQWGWSDMHNKQGKPGCRWVHTPITFDPPLNNGGGGVGGIGGGG